MRGRDAERNEKDERSTGCQVTRIGVLPLQQRQRSGEDRRHENSLPKQMQ
jgi:hypothetical protein